MNKQYLFLYNNILIVLYFILYLSEHKAVLIVIIIVW